jgi:hypothetical protein
MPGANPKTSVALAVLRRAIDLVLESAILNVHLSPVCGLFDQFLSRADMVFALDEKRDEQCKGALFPIVRYWQGPRVAAQTRIRHQRRRNFLKRADRMICSRNRVKVGSGCAIFHPVSSKESQVKSLRRRLKNIKT